MKPITVRNFTGQRSDVSPERFVFGGKEQACDLAAATNILFDKSGMPSRRPGRVKVLTAAGAQSFWSDGTLGLFVHAGSLKRLNADLSATTLAAVDSALPMAFEKADDIVYFNNGKDRGAVEAGHVRAWGLLIPPLPAVSTIGGSMPAGAYQFNVTEVTAQGRESGCGIHGLVTSDGGVRFALAAALNPQATRRRIYLSTVNGADLYPALEVDATAQAVDYVGSTMELAGPLEPLPQFFEPAPPGDVLCLHAGCMYVANGENVSESQPFGFEWFDARDWLALEGRVTVMASSEGEGMFIGTDRAMGYLQGTGPMKERTWTQHAPYGAIRGTLQYVEGSLFGDGAQGARRIPVWLSKRGLCAGMPGGQIVNLTRARLPDFEVDASNGAAAFLSDSSTLVAVAT